MKKFLSISFSLLILLSGMHFTVATHFCGGKVSGTRFSVTGATASCGMGGGAETCGFPQKKHIGSNCCKDKVSELAVDTNYAPTFSDFKAFGQTLIKFFVLTAPANGTTWILKKNSYTNIWPPGHILVSAVSLPDICVFRN